MTIITKKKGTAIHPGPHTPIKPPPVKVNKLAHTPKPDPVKLISPTIEAEEPAKKAMLKIAQPVGTTSTEYKDGSVVETQEKVGDPITEHGPMANVGLSFGMTRKLADFENVKFNVSLFMPSHLDEESLDQTYNTVKAWVDKRCDELNTEISDQLGE